MFILYCSMYTYIIYLPIFRTMRSYGLMGDSNYWKSNLLSILFYILLKYEFFFNICSRKSLCGILVINELSKEIGQKYYSCILT